MNAKEFLATARSSGWNVQSTSSVVKISKRFQPGDLSAFVELDGDYYDLLSNVPVIAGCSSVWGTDGGGIGGMVAIQNGLFVANVSGVKKRFTKSLQQEMNNSTTSNV